MATAKIETDTGTKISVEGSVEEVTKIISLFTKQRPISTPTVVTNENILSQKKKTGQSKCASTLVCYIQELKESGFFDTPKLTALVKKKLDQEGHFYPMQSVSTCLINRNAKKELGRVKEGNKWAYVKR